MKCVAHTPTPAASDASPVQRRRFRLRARCDDRSRVTVAQQVPLIRDSTDALQLLLAVPR